MKNTFFYLENYIYTDGFFPLFNIQASFQSSLIYSKTN